MGTATQPFPEDGFERLREKVAAFLGREPSLYVVDAFAGADAAHRIAVRMITTHPYHALFAKTMFIDLTDEERAGLSSRTRSFCTRPSSRPTRPSTARAPRRSSCCTPRGRRS